MTAAIENGLARYFDLEDVAAPVGPISQTVHVCPKCSSNSDTLDVL